MKKIEKIGFLYYICTLKLKLLIKIIINKIEPHKIILL